MTKTLIALIFALSMTLSLNAKTETVNFKTNITCQGCANNIQSGLEGTDGLNSTSIDVATKTVTLKYDDSKVTSADLTSKIQSLGYTADLVKGDKKSCSTSAKTACSPTSKACATKVKAKKCGDKKNCCSSKTGNQKADASKDNPKN